MKLSGVIAALLALSLPAYAGECVWVSTDRSVAEDTDLGFVITRYGETVPSDLCIDETAGPGTLARVAKCRNGWEGIYFTAPAELDKPGPDERMVLMNTLWYLTCPDNTPMDIEMGN